MSEQEPVNELEKHQNWKAADGFSKEETGDKHEKIEKLFGHCFEISKLDDNDQLPIGGESFFSDEVNKKITCDFKSMDKFFQAIHDYASSLDREEMKKYLEKNKLNVDEELFIPLFTITKALEKKLPPPKDDSEAAEIDKRRKELVFGKDSIKLSDIVNQKCAQCAEIAGLSQYALQNEKIDLSYFSGEIMKNKNWEGSDAHSFNVIHHKGKTYIFDPTNPIDTTSGLFPNINIVEVDFDAEVRKGRKHFVTAKNIVTQKETYYGVNAAYGNVSQEDIV